MSGAEAFKAHLASGLTTFCRAWAVVRSDGETLGFTDHDEQLVFDGVVFQPGSGLSPGAVVQSAGLSVDNTEVQGALSSVAISEADIERGLYDSADVTQWLVNWANPDERMVLFRGQIAQITRQGAGFHAELRGPTARLALSRGRVFQKPCTAVLGDSACGIDTGIELYRGSGTVLAWDGGSGLSVDLALPYPERWFERGVLQVLSGPAQGLRMQIKRDDLSDTGRSLTLWQTPNQGPEPGDSIALIAGCDRRAETCREKFNNMLNFRGFPDLPGEDWLTRFPSPGQPNDGGSLR